MRLATKNSSLRYGINRPRPRNGHKYTKYKMCLRIMMVICIKQHLRNMWSSTHEKVKQHWGWVEKKRSYKKNVYFKINLFQIGKSFKGFPLKKNISISSFPQQLQIKQQLITTFLFIFAMSKVASFLRCVESLMHSLLT